MKVYYSIHYQKCTIKKFINNCSEEILFYDIFEEDENTGIYINSLIDSENDYLSHINLCKKWIKKSYPSIKVVIMKILYDTFYFDDIKKMYFNTAFVILSNDIKYLNL